MDLESLDELKKLQAEKNALFDETVKGGVNRVELAKQIRAAEIDAEISRVQESPDMNVEGKRARLEALHFEKEVLFNAAPLFERIENLNDGKH